MKIRIAAFILILIILTTVLSSCTEADTPNPFLDRFATCSLKNNLTIVVDTITGVCYIYRQAGNGAGMTTLMNADGTPLLYEEAWVQSFGGDK